MRLFLIGFMGSGKSYVGSRLAEGLDMDFIDLDALIVEKAEKSIPEIFAEEGEMAFRTLERDCLRSLGSCDEVVVACGGGTPCFFDNMDWMNAQGMTIFLQTSVDLLAKRLLSEVAQRPLLAGKTRRNCHCSWKKNYGSGCLFTNRRI